MGQIWVKQFAGGLDARRMPETTPGGSLLRCVDCHINRGGEIEQRAAFTKLPSLPAGTVGLAFDNTSLVVFGSGTEPVGMPAGVRYQRLQNPENLSDTLVNVPSFDLYTGKLYVVGEFASGAVFHFYDGVAVEWPFDGRARASLQVVSGSFAPGVQAVGSLNVNGTNLTSLEVINNITVNGVSITGGAFNITGDSALAASLIANQINAVTTNPDYTAVAVGSTVNITAAIVGSAPNGFIVSGSAAGPNFSLGAFVNMAGGVDPTPSKLTSIVVSGISLTAGAVSWATDASQMAEDIATAINAKTGDTDVSAKALSDKITLQFDTPGAAHNGDIITATVSGSLVLSPSSGAFFSGGLNPGDIKAPGKFIGTIDSKIYSGANSLLVFSGVAQPDRFSTDVAGAGFIDFANQATSVKQLLAIAPFQQYGAIFSRRTIFIWVLDPDPSLNKKAQVLRNTGTVSARAVAQFGDSDLFYLDKTGVRSVRARVSTTAASTTDIGVPIDALVQEQLLTLTEAEIEHTFGIIEPIDGRYWLVMKDKIFVFSFFPGSKVSAWAEYRPITFAGGVATHHNIDEAVVFEERVYLRSGNEILVYGGEAASPVYDETQPEVWTSYLDADTPAQPKSARSLDVACFGLWDISIGADPTNTLAEDAPVRVWQTTFNGASVPMEASSTHFSVRFRGVAGVAGPRKIGSLAIHYDADDPAEQR